MTIDSLSLEEKVGQMLCLGWEGEGSYLGLNEQAKRCVTELHAGSMILFSRNLQAPHAPVVETERIHTMLADLKALAQIPMFVAIDQEGGRVARSGRPLTPFPAARAIGDTGDTALAQEAARITAVELSAMGINFNFAPVADINSNPANPVIGDRSFGVEAETVADMVAAQVKGYTEGGIFCCAKHFPGHGDTNVDSHHALPAIAHDLALMQERELVPFRRAIQAGVPAIMTAHILFPALDASGVPATLSKVILTDLLRVSMDFHGLIVTDCLQMKAVADTWGTARAAVMAANAGADILLVCHTWERQKETFTTLVAAAKSGELPMERIDSAVQRILNVKNKLVQHQSPPLSVIGVEEHLAVTRMLHAKAGLVLPETIAIPTLGETAEK